MFLRDLKKWLNMKVEKNSKFQNINTKTHHKVKEARIKQFKKIDDNFIFAY